MLDVHRYDKNILVGLRRFHQGKLKSDILRITRIIIDVKSEISFPTTKVANQIINYISM